MTTPLDYRDPVVTWAQTIVEAVRDRARRHVRWSGVEVVVLPDNHPGPNEVLTLHRPASPLFLPERLADAVRAARAHVNEGNPALRRWDVDDVVEATGQLAAQAIALSGPQGSPIDEEHLADADTVSYLDLSEAEVATGAADVWTQENLKAIWRSTVSGLFLSIDEIPDSGFAGRNPPAARAARAMMTEIDHQRGSSSAAINHGAMSDRLLALAPDQRWDHVVALVPGTERLSATDRWSAPQRLARDFHDAVERNDPQLAVAAIRRVAERADPTRRLAHDQALGPAGLVRRSGDGARGAVWSDTFQSGRRQRER